ncbi:MAG TPA: SMC-Scp complex subunit ScpB [bacterium]|jgi:segregation and condensation protein B|nr:MAG: Segregation and condensation protein B [Parcubacteria group bacterium ADurb.Bin115]HNU81110.1 SMC-Scp complex subunit ScpB [bacterium]HPW05700.1 SMC-Scp complex subunit ScpB [bacterium]HQB75988.1 SMC-Scp complex subunit ScpB [bacterium]HQL34315.1 SMC-Scp complex subunit ScpB [bacterium]
MSSLSSQLESLLLVANKPLSLKELSAATGIKAAAVEEALLALSREYEESGRGWRLASAANNYQLVSAPDNSDLIKAFLKAETSGEWSQPSLEALTIIAYRGPVSKMELDRIRGVNCSLIIRNLLLRGLIEEEFDKKKNENYYQVTLDFIRFLGLNNVTELPDYERLHQPEELKAFLAESEKAC